MSEVNLTAKPFQDCRLSEQGEGEEEAEIIAVSLTQFKGTSKKAEMNSFLKLD